jgi:hypothetical protein
MVQAIGEERYQIATSDSGLTLNTLIEYSDCGNKRTTSATLRMKSEYAPFRLEMTGQSNAGAVIQGTGPPFRRSGSAAR